MKITLPYGIDSHLELDLPEGELVANCAAPQTAGLADVRESLRQTLHSPLEFPPFVQAVVPGDTVAIAIDHGVPKADSLVAEIVSELLTASIEACDITVVRTAADVEAGVADPRGELAEDLRSQVKLVTHNPDCRDELSYLAASSDGKPIYMNRAICDADLVVPIGCARVASSLGYTGPTSGLFPTFSDAHTTGRYRAPRLLDSAARRKRLRAETEEVSWLLGVLFAVQVVPGPGDDVLEIVSGKADMVFAQAQQRCERTWRCEVPHRASLVVAAIHGDATQQNWENVARALSAASHAVEPNGAIALCTDLAADLGPGLQRLTNAEDLEEVIGELSKERPVDALIATELAHALQRGPVYLLSQLEEAVVEDLGIAHIADAAELERLIGHHESCVVLANAQHAVPIPVDELAPSPRSRRSVR
jgi:nickel-dependent lactate racemase